MGLVGIQGHRARGVVVPECGRQLEQPVDVVEGRGIAQPGADQGAELDRVGEVGVGGDRRVQVAQRTPGVVGPDQQGHAVTGRRVARILRQDVLEVGAGTAGIRAEPGHGARDPARRRCRGRRPGAPGTGAGLHRGGPGARGPRRGRPARPCRRGPARWPARGRPAPARAGSTRGSPWPGSPSPRRTSGSARSAKS